LRSNALRGTRYDAADLVFGLWLCNILFREVGFAAVGRKTKFEIFILQFYSAIFYETFYSANFYEKNYSVILFCNFLLKILLCNFLGRSTIVLPLSLNPHVHGTIIHDCRLQIYLFILCFWGTLELLSFLSSLRMHRDSHHA